MIRKTFQAGLVVLVAVFALGSIADAAQQKTVKPRVRHTTRIATRATRTLPAVKRKPAAKPKRKAPKTTKKSPSTSRKTTTKPR